MTTKLKKWLSAILALALLASVTGISYGFVIASNQEVKTENEYYWYNVNDNGEIEAGSQAFGGTQHPVSYAENNLPCPSGSDADCIRGFQNPITSFPSTATGDTDPLQKSL